jgi:hypothetical protein
MTMGEDQANSPSIRSRRWRQLLVPALAASAVVAGAAFVLAPREQTAWFSFVVDSEQTFVSDQIVLMDVGARAGYLLMAVGLLVLAFWLGYRLGVQGTGHGVEKNP